MAEHFFHTELPDDALVTAELLVVHYLDADGSDAYAVHTKGDAPMTTYLGLTTLAQHQIAQWGTSSTHDED